MNFKKHPKGGVTLCHADGMYVDDKCDGDLKQITVIGPMLYSPLEIAESFGEYKVIDLTVIPSDDKKQMAMSRGIFGVVIERDDDAYRDMIKERNKILSGNKTA